MSLSELPSPVWPVLVLLVTQAGDAVMMLRPPKFIVDCLEGVRFPRDWWWALTTAKLASVAGLLAGLWVPGVAMTTTAAIVVYFLAAAVAHLRARALNSAFWINCLGMLLLSLAVLVVSFVRL
ncbi:DoxX family protein [Streptomyces sclerotialus]|uniref:DoxX family protein n=1 Tax=Streptomyces sclerotialus TaxID=1957 RepID=UPI0004C5A956